MSNSDFIRKPLESAFPGHGTMGEVVEAGISLRDYFAAKALQGLISGRAWKGSDEEIIKAWATSAYVVADEMLKARDNG